MPRTSPLGMQKKRLYRLLDVHCNLIIHQCVSGSVRCLISKDDSDSDSDSDSEYPAEFGLPLNIVTPITQELQRLHTIRYLAPRIRRIPKSIEWREQLALHEPDYRFKACFRIHKSSFLTLLHLLHDHPVFHNNSMNPQRPVWQQLMVALYHFGSDGSGGASEKISIKFGIGKGTVYLYTQRVITAILEHTTRLIRWPKPGTRGYRNTVDLHLHFHGYCIYDMTDE